MLNAKTFAIAVAAGFATVLTVYASVSAGVAGATLIPVAALPIYIASLAWGTHAGVIASVASIFFAAGMISPQAAIFVGLAITIPASIIGHQANLAQEDGQGGMEWYPLSRLLFNLAVVITIAVVALGYFMDFQSYAGDTLFNNALKEYFRQNPPPTPLTDDEIGEITQAVFRSLPFMFAGIWLIIHVFNLQISAMICRASNMLPRPKDDIAATVDMPKVGLAILFVSILGSTFLSGGLQLVASVAAGTFLVAYALVGLAASHLRARQSAASFVFLILSYILILLFYLPLFIFSVSGVIRSLSSSNPSPPNANGQMGGPRND